MQSRLFKPVKSFQPQLVRSRILQQLKESLQRPITLIHAPAGYGKSTLVTQLFHELNLDGIWYSLRTSEQTIWGLSEVLLEGLLSAFPDNDELKSVSASIDQLTPQQRFDLYCRYLEQSLAKHSDLFLLVLDNAQLLDDEAIRYLVEVLIHQLPMNCRVLLLTRHLPELELEKMKVNGELSLVDSRDCAFTESETLDLLLVKSRSRSNLNKKLTEAELKRQSDHLYKATSGWPAALHILMMELDQRSNADISQMRVQDSEALHGYFQEQILNKLTPEERNHLLQLVLLKEFNEAMATELFAEQTSPILDNLLKKNLVYILKITPNRVFKLLDPLREFLLLQNQPEKHIYKQFADSYIEQGEKSLALDLLLQIEDFEAASDLVVDLCEIQMLNGNHGLFGDLISRIPNDVIHTNPRLLTLYAWHLPDQEKESLSLPLFEKAERQITPLLEQSLPDVEMQSMRQMLVYLYGFQSFVYRISNRNREALAAADKAIDLAVQYSLRGVARAYSGKTQVAFIEGDLSTAEAMAKKAIAYSKLEMDLVSLPIAFGYLINLHCILGRFKEAETTKEATLTWAREHNVQHFPMLEIADCFFLEIQREKNQLNECMQSLQKAEKYCKSGVPQTHQVALEFGKIQLAVSIGDLDMAARSVQKLRTLMPVLENQPQLLSYSFPSLTALEATLDALQGKADRHLIWIKNRAKQLQGNNHFVQEKEKLLVARLLAIFGEEGEALQLLNELQTTTEQQHRVQHHIQTLVAKVVYYWLRGDQVQARKVFFQAVELGVPLGYLRTFIDLRKWIEPLFEWGQSQVGIAPWVQKVMAENGTENGNFNVYQQQLNELSKRELMVLELISNGLSNKEIADELSVTIHTIKTFASSLFRKLEVRNRTEASDFFRKSQSR